MDAVNVMKGYDKVNDHHHLHDVDIHFHSPPTHKRSKPTVIVISAVLVLTLIIGLMLATVVIHESEEEDERKQLDAVESIKTVCSVTQNPDSCFTTLSSSLNISFSSTKPNPEVILKLSLQVNVKELANVTALIKRLNENHNHPRNDHEVIALRDCMDQLGDAVSRLNDSISEMLELDEGEKEKQQQTLTDRKVNDIQTWISAAMTDEETCLDGLEEMGSTSVAYEVKSKMKKSKELLSYSLAIIANIQTLLQKFGITTMH